MIIDNATTRLVFNNAKAALASYIQQKQLNLNLSAAKLTQSYIRSEILINNTNAVFQVQTLINQNNNAGTIYNTERRLALQDWFITSAIGVFLAVPASSTDGAYRYYTYPDPNVFSTSGAGAAAQALYNGFLSLTIDNDVVVPEWDLSRHFKIPNQQYAANAYYTTSAINYQSEIDGDTDGYYPVEPNWIFNGASNLDFKINMPQAIVTVQTNSRIVVIQHGIKAQNVTSVK